MKKICCILIVLVGVLASCARDEQEVKDISEILPSSSRDYSVQPKEALENGEDSLNFYKQQFLSNGILIDGLIRIEDKSFPDRFNPKSSDRFQLILDNDTLSYQRWIYNDSAKMKSAFFNWLDCFGENCVTVAVGEEKKLMNEPFQLFANDSTLIWVVGEADVNRWHRYHSLLGFGTDWKYVIVQGTSGKAKWFKYSEGEKIPINREENEDS